MAQQTPPKPAAPRAPAKKPAPNSARRRKDRLEAGNLVWYLIYAFLLHLLFLGLSAFSDNLDTVIQVKEIPVELMGVEEPAQKEEGGAEEEPEPEPEPQPVLPQPQAKVVPDLPPPIEQPPIDVSEALEAIETNSTETVYRKDVVEKKEDEPIKEPDEVKPIERKQVSIAAAAARAAGRGGNYGLGRGKGGGRGGLGEGFGIKDKDLPIISGGAVFGTGRKGALKGHLCFVPVGTKRLSDVGRCKPEGVMYTNMLNVTPRRFTHGFPGVSERFEWFAIDYNGRFTVSKAGEYKFRLHTDDGSLLWINGKQIINNDGTHPPESKIGTINLEEGKHRIRVFYFQGPRTEVALQLFVAPPGEPERLWSPKL